MSTKDIRRVLNWMQHNQPAGTAQVVAAALTEVEAIEAAAREFAEHGEDARSSAWQLMERIAK